MLGKAFLLGQVKESKELTKHIDHCLVCRSCEKCCPSGVQFGAFIDGLRHHLSPAKKSHNEFADILVNKNKRRALNKKLWLGQRSGALSIGKFFLGKTNTRLIETLPKVERFQTVNKAYPAKGTEFASVMLFTGCNSELLGNSLVFTAIALLTQLGVSVDVPEQQVCCGGLSRHHGDAETANDLEAKNINAFNSESDIPIITLASGCGASLLDYNGLDNDSASQAFASRIVDINHFILAHLKNNATAFKPLNRHVLLHTPCSLKNVMRQDSAVEALLSMIPDLKVESINSQQGCCGAAGTYMYEHANNADALREPILNEVKRTHPEILVTTNIGCAMHIQSGLNKAGIKTNLSHPIELLIEAIK